MANILFITISTSKKAVGRFVTKTEESNADENLVETAASSLAAQASLPTVQFAVHRKQKGTNINLCLNKIHNTVDGKV